MKIPLVRLNVMVGIAKLERISKSELERTPLVKAARTLVSQATAPAPRALSPLLPRERRFERQVAQKPKEASTWPAPEASFRRSQQAAPDGTRNGGSTRDAIDNACADSPAPPGAGKGI